MKKMCISIITIAIDVRIRYGPNFVSAFFDTFRRVIIICNSLRSGCGVPKKEDLNFKFLVLLKLKFLFCLNVFDNE